MAGIYIRIDVDKPFGKKNIIPKILSKLREDYYFPLIKPLYLKGLEEIVKSLNENNIIAHIYFRNCTYPLPKQIELLNKGKHIIGFHAENTRNINTFKNEISTFSKKINTNIASFTKHGSGTYKLGKNHYPKYEPNKYQNWAKKLNLKFPFGNKIITNKSNNKTSFFENAFWIEQHYRHPSFNTLNQLIDYAKTNEVVVLIHPSNYQQNKKVKNDFNLLIKMVKENKITIKTI